MEWTNDLIYEFLNLLENEPAIWNTSSPQHKNKNDVHDAWLRIKSSLKDGTISVTELKKKKENLTSTYRKIRSKIRDSMKTGSGTNEIYKPEWPFYNTMAIFLDNVYKPRSTKSTENTSEKEDDSKDERTSEKEDDSKDESDEASNEANNNLETNEEQNMSFKMPKIIPKKKKKLDETQSRMDEAYNYLKQLNQKPKKDVSAMYCDQQAEKLRNLKEHTRELAMLEIDKLVFNLKLSENPPTLQTLPPHAVGYPSPYRSQSSAYFQHSFNSQPSSSQNFFNPQQSLSIQLPQNSPTVQPSPSHSSGYQSPYHSQSLPQSVRSFHSQPPSPQTSLNPQQSPSVQLPQNSPTFQPSPSHSSGYQSPYHSQSSLQSDRSFHSQPPSPQTSLNPQQSPSVQLPQNSPTFQPSPSHSSGYQSPYHSQSSPQSDRSFHSQPPSPQTSLNPQQSPSVLSPSHSPSYRSLQAVTDMSNQSLKDFYESQDDFE